MIIQWGLFIFFFVICLMSNLSLRSHQTDAQNKCQVEGFRHRKDNGSCNSNSNINGNLFI